MNNLYKCLQTKFELFKDQVAIKNKRSAITYGTLNLIANKISKILKDKCISSNIGIFGKKDIFTYKAVIGVVYANKTYVPLNENFTTKKINTIINDAKINTIITTKENVSYIQENISNICYILVLEDKDVELIEISKTQNLYTQSKLAYILFTSGSTGAPKGVMVTKENILSYIKTKQKQYDFETGLNFAQISSLGFDLSVLDIYLCFVSGGVLHVIDEAELLCPNEYIVTNKIEVWYSAPIFAINLNKLGVLEPNSFPSLKYTFFAGEPLPQNIAIAWLQAAPNTILENLYGTTEATVDVTRYRFDKSNFKDKYYNDILPIGKAIDNQNIVLIDKDNKIINTKYTNGEIIISGTQVSNGYLNDEQKTNSAFVKLPLDNCTKIWYKTGDLAFYNNNMDLEFHSRIDTQIKISGKRIEIGELEYVFKSNKIIENIVIVPKKDHNGRVVELVAFILEDLSSKDIKDMQKQVMLYLDKVFIPRRFIYIKEYPKTLSDKIDRKALENMI
jgi:amino acid adenylation domain-containing protein